MGCLIFTMVTVAIVTAAIILWLGLGWLWSVIFVVSIIAILVMWRSIVVPIIDNELGIRGWHGENDDND